MIQYNKKYISLFSFCKVVKGKEKSIICDFQKEKIKFIPNEMGTIIEMLKTQPYKTVREQFKEDEKVFDSYIEFLSSEGFIFETDSTENFVPIKKEWLSPEVINNAIIEYGFENFDLINVLTKLDHLLVKFLELRITNFGGEHITELENILKFCSQSVLRSLRIYVPYTSKKDSNKIIELTKRYPIVEGLVFYSCKSNRFIQKDSQEIFYISETLNDITKANIDRKFLVNNINYYYESQSYNPYYNKKITINSIGDIKNCIKNKAIHGNVNTSNIEEVVLGDEFQEFWGVTHDQIVDIQESELRYNYIITNDLEKIEDGKYKIVV